MEIVVIRQSKSDSSLGNSRPCADCLRIMKLLKIKNVYYTNIHGAIICEKISKMKSDHISQMNRCIKTDSIF